MSTQHHICRCHTNDTITTTVRRKILKHIWEFHLKKFKRRRVTFVVSLSKMWRCRDEGNGKNNVTASAALNHSSGGVVFRKCPLINTKVFFWHGGRDIAFEADFGAAWQSPCGTTLCFALDSRNILINRSLSLNAAVRAIIFRRIPFHPQKLLFPPPAVRGPLSFCRCASAPTPPWLTQNQRAHNERRRVQTKHIFSERDYIRRAA